MRPKRTYRYKGHKITEAVEMGWSDSQQGMVENGLRVTIEGPIYSRSFQTYLGVDPAIYQEIDRAIAKAQGRDE